jgi:hypothetical protein
MMRLNAKQLCCLAYFLFYFMSGFLRNPFLALVISLFYEVGFVGLMMIYKSREALGSMRWVSLVGGFVMVMISTTWLDALLKLVGGL